MFENEAKMLAASLESSRWSSFAVALSAINWPCPVWLERNFTFLPAVGTGCLVRLFGIHLLFHLLFYYYAKLVCTLV
jgi:hypothetical protein